MRWTCYQCLSLERRLEIREREAFTSHLIVFFSFELEALFLTKHMYLFWIIHYKKIKQQPANGVRKPFIKSASGNIAMPYELAQLHVWETLFCWLDDLSSSWTLFSMGIMKNRGRKRKTGMRKQLRDMRKLPWIKVAKSWGKNCRRRRENITICLRCHWAVRGETSSCTVCSGMDVFMKKMAFEKTIIQSRSPKCRWCAIFPYRWLPCS